MNHSYDTIYLSPHLDDVVLSCGGQIFQQVERGETVLVVTIAAAEPQTDVRSVFAQFLHHNWGFSANDVVALRRLEDLEACQRLGAVALHGPLPDCIYRLHPQQGTPLYTSNEDIFGRVHPSEEAILEDIERFMISLPSASAVVAPLAAGNHVDHQLTRAAAERVWGSALLYYEDYPYVQRDPSEVSRLTQPPAQWRSDLILLSAAALATRVEAILAYRSQISTIFNSVEEMESAVAGHVAATGGERRWQRLPAEQD